MVIIAYVIFITVFLAHLLSYRWNMHAHKTVFVKFFLFIKIAVRFECDQTSYKFKWKI